MKGNCRYGSIVNGCGRSDFYCLYSFFVENYHDIAGQVRC